MKKIFKNVQLVFKTIFSLLGVYKADKKLISGVCSGLASKFRINVWLVRLVFLISLPVTLGLSILFYLFLASIMPKKVVTVDNFKNIYRNYSNNYRREDYIDVNGREL